MNPTKFAYLLVSIVCLFNKSNQQQLELKEKKVEPEWTTKEEDKMVSSTATTSLPHLSSEIPDKTETIDNILVSKLPSTTTNQPRPVFFQPSPLQVEYRPAGPYIIQQHTYTNTGELIVENLIGGVPFDCRFKPTGHWRDGKYCDIFHACVFGQQRKSYACPFVGERTYFDEITKKCEFARLNPSDCSSNTFHF